MKPLIYNILCIITLFTIQLEGVSQSNNRLQIPYNNWNLVIDGLINDWPDKPLTSFHTSGNADNNTCQLRMLWDESYLYVSIYIEDSFLVALEPSDDPDRIHLNDGFELYIDSQNDSGDKFDINDFQFIFDISGGRALFRGDRLNQELNHQVPKDTRVAKIIYYSKVSTDGSINDNADFDKGYTVECKIPWTALGMSPSAGMVFKADFCINDNDTLQDMRSVPEGPVHNYSGTSMLGFADYGFPTQWPVIELTGSAGLTKRLESLISDFWIVIILLLTGFVILGSVVFYLLISTLRKIPNREAQKDLPLVQYVITENENFSNEAGKHPYIHKVREIVLSNLDKQIRTEELANELATSVRQLQRVFKQEFNTTPKIFVITIKIELAAHMLLDPANNISEVAYALGFSDPSYFSKVFKKYYSLSPTEYQAGSGQRGRRTYNETD